MENMKSKHEIFFAEKGLTSTSANHIANMAKELYQGLEIELNGIKFYSTGINLIGAPVSDTNLLENGTNDVALSKVKDKLKKVANLKSLIAWLREAIKAREELNNELNNLNLVTFCDMKGLDYPILDKVEMDENKKHIITEDEYYAGLSLKERNRYYELETMVSTIGKYIHERGKLSVEREALKNKIEHPTNVDANGRDTLIYTYAPSVSKEAVDEVFFELQNLHREYQKQLNSMKFECDNAIQQSKIEFAKEAENIRTGYNVRYKAATEKYNAELNSITCQFSVFMTEENKRISDLKIVIPDSLQETYDYVNSYGEKYKD